MVNHSLAPALFDVQDAFKGPYAPRIQAFTEAGQQADLTSAHDDREKIAVILVDYQHDFVDPTGTLYTARHREYLWSFDGREAATTWQTSYDEEIAETEGQIRAYYAADAEMAEAIHKKADGYQGMSEAQIAETEGRINGYYAAFREQELAAAREEESRASSETAEAPMTRAERSQARAELLREIQDTLKRLSAASPIAATQDPDRP